MIVYDSYNIFLIFLKSETAFSFVSCLYFMSAWGHKKSDTTE